MNAVRRHKEFKCCFTCQNPQKLISVRKLYPNCDFYPFLKHILSVFHFVWLLGGALSVDKQTIDSKSRHVDKMITSYKNKGGGFQADALCDGSYTYAFFLVMKVYQRNTR